MFLSAFAALRDLTSRTYYDCKWAEGFWRGEAAAPGCGAAGTGGGSEHRVFVD